METILYELSDRYCSRCGNELVRTNGFLICLYCCQIKVEQEEEEQGEENFI
jgi:uncharacterized Zn finger protein (UPF0148 family)